MGGVVVPRRRLGVESLLFVHVLDPSPRSCSLDRPQGGSNRDGRRVRTGAILVAVVTARVFVKGALMPRNARRLLANAALYALAALGGLFVAVIIILNLHIIVGLEEGYAAGPVEVLESSVLVALADVALLIAGPLLGILAVSRLRPRDTDW
ncbi:MAG: hypothetical protein Q8O61_10485 [Nocardioides sp.]|nr:hypothetical protein [Nocardioides sp.]